MSGGIHDTSAGRCTAGLIVKGEWFGCDLATEHDGWAHNSRVAEAIWNDGGEEKNAEDSSDVSS